MGSRTSSTGLNSLVTTSTKQYQVLEITLYSSLAHRGADVPSIRNSLRTFWELSFSRDFSRRTLCSRWKLWAGGRGLGSG
eukprot:370595-Amorphochlora_amoeboformis.AAC.1